MRRRIALQMTAAACVAMSFGCQLIPHRAGRERRSWVAQADSILLKKKATGKQFRLIESDDITQFCQMYASLKWKQYWHTVPVGLDARTMDLMNGETQLAHFSLFGELWEIESYSQMKTAELNSDQDKWLKSLFLRFDETSSSTEQASQDSLKARPTSGLQSHSLEAA
jgi:hypothetical protein